MLSTVVLRLAKLVFVVFFFQAEDGIRDGRVTGVQTCALPISHGRAVGGEMERGDGMNRAEAVQLMQEHTQSPSLRQHMLAVEAAMRAYAEKHGADPETWGIVGLLHDFDYEKFPNHEHSPTDGHPAWGVGLLREQGVPEPMCRAILGHGAYTGVPRDSLMAQTLFAVDELCGFLVACALVRPSKSFVDLEVSSVKK